MNTRILLRGKMLEGVRNKYAPRCSTSWGFVGSDGVPVRVALLMSILIPARRTVVAPGQLMSCFRAVSLDNLPPINQRSLFVAEINL
jgi:hypothetical protein